MKRINKLASLLECDPNIYVNGLFPFNIMDGGPTSHKTCKEYSYDKNENQCDETTYFYNDNGDQIKPSQTDNICK